MSGWRLPFARFRIVHTAGFGGRWWVHVPNVARFFDNPCNKSASSASCRLERDLETFTTFGSL